MRKDEIKQTDGWKLVCEAIRGETYDRLTSRQRNMLLKATWAENDAYGEVGYTPVQGWDWSGIRDSSPEAKERMADRVRTLLGQWGIVPEGGLR